MSHMGIARRGNETAAELIPYSSIEASGNSLLLTPFRQGGNQYSLITKSGLKSYATGMTTCWKA